MAIKITRTKSRLIDSQFGKKTEVTGTVSFDASQAAAGESIVLGELGLSTINSMAVENFQLADTIYQPMVDVTNKIVDVFVSSTGAIASGVDLSSATAVPFIALGDA